MKLEVIPSGERDLSPVLPREGPEGPDPDRGGKWTAEEVVGLQGVERRRAVDAVRQRRNKWKLREQKKYFEENFLE